MSGEASKSVCVLRTSLAREVCSHGIEERARGTTGTAAERPRRGGRRRAGKRPPSPGQRRLVPADGSGGAGRGGIEGAGRETPLPPRANMLPGLFWQRVRPTWDRSQLGVPRAGCFFLHFHLKDEIVRRGGKSCRRLAN